MQRSIGSDSQGRATAANNKRQLGENRKPFNCLPMQINTNKSRDAAASPQKREGTGSAQCKELFASALSNDLLQNCQVSEEDGRGEPAMESSQMVKICFFCSLPSQTSKYKTLTLKKLY